jgi:hypothetical protein
LRKIKTTDTTHKTEAKKKRRENNAPVIKRLPKKHLNARSTTGNPIMPKTKGPP